MGMDSQGYIQPFIGKMFLGDLDDLRDLVRQGAAVCVAQHQTLGAALHRLVQSSQSIFAVLLEAVKKMLGIIKQVFNMGF